ncbi:WS/DGAT domain-containing protein [Nocardia sp. CDC153]|uniref:WS/DGAT domain-containing protein n=1 Tax=Nocardia sp. CDC153 TaxID=3112167 RepID=UPI002DB9DA72|nr:WS/DGAT domain-containing protein [Nocardia sp. CDC153]MEC3955692.1 WS/DGAT domain-containing protein [Nocardia sp. CDC153]
MNSLAARDAAMYWLSARTPNDLFLLYCFVDVGSDAERLRAAVAKRVEHVPDLLIHVLDTPANLAYPIWAPCEFTNDQFVDHELAAATWANVTAAVGGLVGTGLRAEDRPWRLHVFRNVRDAPGFAAGESALVAVLQLSHALADGRRAAVIARELFGHSEFPAASGKARTTPFIRRLVPDAIGESITSVLSATMAIPGIPIGMARTVVRGLGAARAQRRLAELTAAGALPPPAPDTQPNALNGGGATPVSHSVRMLVCDKDRLRAPGHSVTVVFLTAVSIALERHLREAGEAIDGLRAQVPMAFAGTGVGRNGYRDLSVDLAVAASDPRARAARIAADLAARRERAAHPLQGARDAVTAVLPAPLLHRDVAHAPIDILPERVSGHTVVSSVDRGAADLEFGGGAVRFTAGFPALGAVMHLTHGLHGLGDTVTLSVHADPAVLPDPDRYASLLEAAVDEVATALRAPGTALREPGTTE